MKTFLNLLLALFAFMLLIECEENAMASSVRIANSAILIFAIAVTAYFRFQPNEIDNVIEKLNKKR